MSELMDAVVDRENLKRAYSRVMRNKGAPGVDAMPVGDLATHLQVHWPRIREELLEGRYQPSAVREVSIPKPNGQGERHLGIPTVTDRLIQQALHQVLSPRYDPDFSESSYGFRPGRHARQAVQQARQYVQDGRRWVVDLDLAQFFDCVNHDTLDGWLRRKLRCLLWRQFKRPFARARRLMQQGLSEQRAWTSATNGRGPWWNAGASHMNQSYPKSFFDRLGLVSLLDQYRRLTVTS